MLSAIQPDRLSFCYDTVPDTSLFMECLVYCLRDKHRSQNNDEMCLGYIATELGRPVEIGTLPHGKDVGRSAVQQSASLRYLVQSKLVAFL